MKLTAFALRQKRLTLTFVAFVVVMGALAFFNLPRFEDPRIVFRYAMVEARFPGASAARVDDVVVEPMEQAIIESIPELDWMRSQSHRGVAVSVVAIKERYTEVEPIWERLRKTLAEVAAEMDPAVEGPLIREDFDDVFGIIVAVSGAEDTDYSVLEDQAARLREALLGRDQVGRVAVIAQRREEVMVEFDDTEMADSEATPRMLVEFLQAQNLLLPGGFLEIEGKQRLVETMTQPDSVEELAAIPVPQPGEEAPKPLKELVEIRRQFPSPADSYLFANGRRAVGLAIALREDGSVESLGKQVEEELEAFRARAPSGVSFDPAVFEPDRLNSRINSFFLNLGQSLLVVLVILVIALGLRTGSVVALTMPLIILAALAVMYLLGIPLTLVALAAFIVVLGMMVDNHIVISERILRLRERGFGPKEASLRATDELHAPLLTAALTTIVGFLPIYLAESVAGEYVAPLFIIVTITLLCSEFFGFTLTPLLGARFFDPRLKTEQPHYDGPFYQKYRRMLERLLAHPWIASLAVLLLFGLAILGLTRIPVIFFPTSDRPIFTMELELEEGTGIETTREAARAVDAFVAENLWSSRPGTDGGVSSWSTFVGRNAPRFVLNHRPREHSPNYAYFLFNTGDYRNFDRLRGKLLAFAQERFPYAQARVLRIESGPALGWPIKIRLFGEDADTIAAAAEEVKAKLAAIPELENINDDWGGKVPRVEVEPKWAEAASHGLTAAEIGYATQMFLTGVPATAMRLDGENLPVLVRSTVLEGRTLEGLGLVSVYTSEGEPVYLEDVAEINVEKKFPQIVRRDHELCMSVRADVVSGANATTIQEALAPWVAGRAEDWEGVHVELQGEANESSKANASILRNLPLTGFLILLLLIAQTRSFRKTFIILMSVPLGLIGVVAGLLLLGQPLGFMTLVGIVALTGIVVNNAIILIDRIRYNRKEHHLEHREAVVEASLNRLRPILLTTVTTIGGIIPLYLRGNPTFQPMAAALVFGLIFATVLVLVVVPVLHQLLFPSHRENPAPASEAPPEDEAY